MSTSRGIPGKDHPQEGRVAVKKTNISKGRFVCKFKRDLTEKSISGI